MATTHQKDSYWSLDVLLMGGLSVIIALGYWAFMDKNISVYTVSMLAFSLAFLANHPHFLSSYILLYGDYRNRVLTQASYFWAGVVVPVFLGSILIYALFKSDIGIMGHVVNWMFFLVGWHYVKQVFGCVIVTSAQRKIFYSKWEKAVLLTNLFLVWSMSFINGQVGQQTYKFYEIPYQSLNLPAEIMKIIYAGVVISMLATFFMQVRKYIVDGVKPSPPAVAAFVALYVWYIPSLYHPGFSYLIPFFHSLQYLAFVWVLKKNKTAYQVSDLVEREQRIGWIRRFVGFIILALVLGATFFEFLPKWLDQMNMIPANTMGSSPFLAAFLLFINVHHYFIDNVIWRSENRELRQHLFQTEPVSLTRNT